MFSTKAIHNDIHYNMELTGVTSTSPLSKERSRAKLPAHFRNRQTMKLVTTKMSKQEFNLEKKQKPKGEVLNRPITNERSRDKLNKKYENSQTMKLSSKHMNFARNYKRFQYDTIVIEL
jgi:hypothetical protein|tara:strand:- start:132 stop:488 length:357 start_codon:yes stop_codon:yes gene_type:complete